VQGRERRLTPGFRIGLKEDGLSERCRPRQQDFTLGWAGGYHRLQQLPDDPERQLSLQLASARRQNAQIRCCCDPSGREQTRFADPRRPFQDDSPARARSGTGEQPLHHLELELPLYERSQLHSHDTILERCRRLLQASRAI
jgi:hypothetical protein